MKCPQMKVRREESIESYTLFIINIVKKYGIISVSSPPQHFYETKQMTVACISRKFH